MQFIGIVGHLLHGVEGFLLGLPVAEAAGLPVAQVLFVDGCAVEQRFEDFLGLGQAVEPFQYLFGRLSRMFNVSRTALGRRAIFPTRLMAAPPWLHLLGCAILSIADLAVGWQLADGSSTLPRKGISPCPVGSSFLQTL